MSNQLIDYGWEIPYGNCDIIDNQLVFSEESVVIRKNQEWKNVEVSADFLYKGSDIGIVLCYNSIGYLLFKVSTSECKLLRIPILNNNENITIGEPRTLKIEKLQTNLTADTELSLRVVREGTNVKGYLEDNLVLNTEESLYKVGKIGLYGNSGEVSKGVLVKQLFSEQWSIVNKRDGDCVSLERLEDGSAALQLDLATSSDLIVGASQTISTEIGKQYTVQCSYVGSEIHVSFAGIEVEGALEGEGAATYSQTFTATETSHDLIVGGKSPSRLSILDVQVEEKPYKTSYTYNESNTAPAIRGDASLSYPLNNINILQGSVSLWLKPRVDYSLMSLSEKPLGIFYYGDDLDSSIRIYYNGVSVVFNYGAASVSYPISLLEGEVYHIVATWDAVRDKIQLFVLSKEGTANPDDMKIEESSSLSSLNIISEKIDVGGDALSRVCNGVIDNFIVYNRAISPKDIYLLFVSEREPDDNGNMLIRANFNNGIGNFDWTTIDINPLPLPGSPVIVKKSDGTIMRKVSFTDSDSNKYVPYYKEVITYKGGDIVSVSVGDLDYKFFNMGIYSENGLKIAGIEDINIESSEGKNIKLLYPLPEDYLDKDLEVWYQPKDCYTVDFNVNDACRITLGKNDGEPVSVIYEANPDIGDYSLAETVELNSVNNPNNQGFMYITQEAGEAEIFRASLSPDEIVANGYDYSLIILEIVDKYGNPVSNVDYEFATKSKRFTGFPMKLNYGSIQPYKSPEYEKYLQDKQDYLDLGHTDLEWYENYGHFIGLNERAGRQIFLYKSNRLVPRKAENTEAIEKILVRDSVSGLGTEIKIRLVAMSDYKLIN